MGTPEDIPEDRQESYPCPDCDEGNITLQDNGYWECDNCDWSNKCSK